MYSWSFPEEKILPVELLGQGSCVFVKASNACFPSSGSACYQCTLCSAAQKKIYSQHLCQHWEITWKKKKNFCQFYRWKRCPLILVWVCGIVRPWSWSLLTLRMCWVSSFMSNVGWEIKVQDSHPLSVSKWLHLACFLGLMVISSMTGTFWTP